MSVTIFGPDFPFAYDDWLSHKDGIGAVPAARWCIRYGGGPGIDAHGPEASRIRIWKNRRTAAF